MIRVVEDAPMLNHGFWAVQFNEVFVPQIRALIDTLRDRLLPVFDNIEAEAERKVGEEYQRLCSQPASVDGDVEMADLSEASRETGLDHCFMMSGVRQGLQNMFAAALYHLYEQQVMLFHRREVLDPREESEVALFTRSEFQKRLRGHGVDVTSFASWPLIDELRLVANTVKHAGGKAASDLHSRRPDLFIHPSVELPPSRGPGAVAHVFQPIMGEDLYVSLEEITGYARAVERFWSELSETMALG